MTAAACRVSFYPLDGLILSEPTQVIFHTYERSWGCRFSVSKPREGSFSLSRGNFLPCCWIGLRGSIWGNPISNDKSNRQLRRVFPLPKPSLLAQAFNPTQSKCTLLRFGLCGIFFPASQSASQLSSSCAILTPPLHGSRSVALECSLAGTVSRTFGPEIHFDLCNLVDNLTVKTMVNSDVWFYLQP